MNDTCHMYLFWCVIKQLFSLQSRVRHTISFDFRQYSANLRHKQLSNKFTANVLANLVLKAYDNILGKTIY